MNLERRAPARINWLLLVNVALGNFLAGTSSRIFSVSLPTIAASLETTIVGISWAVIAYQISQISLSLIFGRIGDLYGRHALFGAGLVISSVAALLCGLSQTATQLILFRFFQGLGASMTQSQGRALALESASEESSGRVQGFMTTAFHSGVLIGPSLGGLFIDTIHWRAVFFFLIPIALCALLLTLVNWRRGNVPQRRAPVAHAGSVDYPGAMLLIGATTALIAAIDHRIMEGAGPVMRAALLVSLAIFVGGFLYREWITRSPILDLSLFKIRMFTLSSLALLMVGIAQVMIGFVLPFYLQDILRLTPTFIGLLFISAPVFTVILSPLVGWAVDKLGARLPATVGISFLASAAFYGSYLHSRSHWLSAVAVLGLWGLATALFFYSEPYGDDYVRARPTSWGCHRRDLCCLWARHHHWRLTGHAPAHGGVSSLHRRSCGESERREPRNVCASDEFYFLDRRLHGIGGNAVFQFAWNR